MTLSKVSTYCTGPVSLAIAILFASVAHGYDNGGVARYDNVTYLNNGTIVVGVDLQMGGAITYLSTPGETNFVNNIDLGRQIQTGIYDGPFPFAPPGVTSAHDAPWNPIQSGDVYGNRSQVIDYRITPTEIYTKSIPMHWHLDGYPGECTMEQWTTIDNSVVTVRSRLNNARPDLTQYHVAQWGQESPAVYLNAAFPTLVTYSGTHPFTNDALTVISQPKWRDFHATENWAAYVNNYNYGVGVFQAGCNDFNAQFDNFGLSGNGSSDLPFSYMCPAWKDVLDHNISYEFTYQVVVGNLEDIRSYAVNHRPDPRPNYHFEADRQHWYYVNASDSGWPITGHMHVNLFDASKPLNQQDPQMISPPTSFQAADVSKLYIYARFNLDDATEARGELFWETNNGDTAPEGWLGPYVTGATSFDIINDGKYHLYSVDLAGLPGYSGMISWLRFDPAGNTHAGDYMDIQYISFVPEPSSIVMLLGTGLVGVLVCVWRRRRLAPIRWLHSRVGSSIGCGMNSLVLGNNLRE